MQAPSSVSSIRLSSVENFIRLRLYFSANCKQMSYVASSGQGNEEVFKRSMPHDQHGNNDP